MYNFSPEIVKINFTNNMYMCMWLNYQFQKIENL
jgi:hypothetical protein